MRDQFLLRSGFILEAARNEHGSDCDVRVSIDGAEVARWTEPKNGWHYQTHTLDTKRWAGQKVALEIEVSARDEDFRDLCVNGFAMEL